MLYVRMLCVYGIFCSLSIFISTNVKEILHGSGYEYLAVMVAAFGLLILLSKDFNTLLRLRKATLFLIVFLTYFGVKFYFESNGDTYETKQVTVGTTGGIIFAFGLGIICAYAIATLYQLRRNPATHRHSGYLGMAYLMLVFAFSLDAYSTHSGSIRLDVFLIQGDEGYYQRVGGLLLLQNMVAMSLSTVMVTTMRRATLTRILPAIGLIFAIVAVSALTSQLVGSNSGFVSILSFQFIYLVFIGVIYLKGTPSKSERIGLFNIMASPLGAKLLLGSLTSAACIALVGVLVINHMQLDVYKFRIMAFGENELSSVTSRGAFFKQNFVDHFFYAPLFGNTQVEKHTTGDGTYVHSLLSILTHLGLVGFTIFLAMVYYLYAEITSRKREGVDSLYCNQPYALFRLMGMGLIIVMAVASAFLTWTPLWFALGLYGAWYHERRMVSSG